MTKAEKILSTLARLCQETDSAITYEDLVVAAFETYPGDFSLRGYPHYPDASDIHKPIYNHLKPQGLVRVSNKTFRITEAGLEAARRLSFASNVEYPEDDRRLTRSQERALRRYEKSSAVQLMSAGKEDDLIDTDCQRFYGFAPWSSPSEASARRQEFLTILDILEQLDTPTASILRTTDQELTSRFGFLLDLE